MTMEPIIHLPNFIEGEDFLDRLLRNIPWTQMTWSTGKSLPRLTYRYDGRVIPVLEELKGLVEVLLTTKVKGIWCNHYRNGQDWTPYHADTYGCHVFSLSFGASRDFFIREKGKSKTRQTFNLKDGDGFYFTPEINLTHEHSVPKRSLKKCDSPRVSVVFFIDKPLFM